MRLKVITYKTLMGTKKVYKSRGKVAAQWVVCQDNKPTCFVDCFDFVEPSNGVINDLVLKQGKTMKQILEKIMKKENI